MTVKCTWTQEDEGGPWWSSCDGHYFEFTDGGPKENEFKFCCWCGGDLESVPYVYVQDDDE